MATVATRDVRTFLETGWARYSLILLFGPDEGLVNERATLLAEKSVEGARDNILRFDGDDISADPLRLLDEAHAISMFGGRRCLRVKLGARAVTAVIAPLLSAPPQDCLVIFEAGDLKKNHALRKTFEEEAKLAAIACYADEARDVSEIAVEIAARFDLKFDRVALDFLKHNLGADHKQSRSEIEKIALYCHGQGQITESDVRECLNDETNLQIDDLVDLVFTGQTQDIDSTCRKHFERKMDPGALIGQALRHAMQLADGFLSQKGGNAQELVASLRGLHWKRKATVTRQFDMWTDTKISRAISILAEAQQASRENQRLAETIAIRAFWSVSLAAGSRR